MFDVTLLDGSTIGWYRKTWADNQKFLSQWFNSIPRDNTLVLLKDGSPVASVRFSYSRSQDAFTELNTMTPAENRRKGYQKILLKAFATVVSEIPEISHTKTCLIHVFPENVDNMGFHSKTAEYVGPKNIRGVKMVEFKQDIDVWRNYDTPPFNIAKCVKDRFLTRVMQFRIRNTCSEHS